MLRGRRGRRDLAAPGLNAQQRKDALVIAALVNRKEVCEASVSSVLISPVSLRKIQSLARSTAVVRARVSRLVFLQPAQLQAWLQVLSAVPVIRKTSALTPERWRSCTKAPVRPSDQRMAGRTGRPAASTSQVPSP